MKAFRILLWLSAVSVTIAHASDGKDEVNPCLDLDSDLNKCRVKKGVMDLSKCNLVDTDVDELRGCFKHVKPSRIKKLYLNGNHLAELPQDIFKGLSKLRMLRLQGNELTSLPTAVFKGRKTLRDLYLDGNYLSGLPEGIFEDQTSLRRLYLADNELETLPKKVFSGMKRLQKLYLEGNRLTTLPAGIFDGLKLKTLSLKDNSGLTCLPKSKAKDVKAPKKNFKSEKCGCDFVDDIMCGAGQHCAAGEEGYTCGGE